MKKFYKGEFLEMDGKSGIAILEKFEDKYMLDLKRTEE